MSMNDNALAWITRQVQQVTFDTNTQSLWCADENALTGLPLIATNSSLLLISNRWDVAQEAIQKNFHAEFSDFEFAAIASNSLDHVFYRISKEKPVVHHIVNEAWRCLKPGGKLYIAGHKNEGIKTFIEKTTALFGDQKNILKDGSAYFASIEKKLAYDESQMLDDSAYQALRPLDNEHHTLHTKPGLFGWNKIDQGSEYLIQQFDQILREHHKQPTRVLDLGCGYGYLSVAASQGSSCQDVSHWTMTDNNAAAIKAATYNAHINKLNAEVIAADCGDAVTGSFDVILCNPPFHQGFVTEGDLTDRFLAASKKLLAKDGIAIFVVNQFIPLERKASGLFRQVKTEASNGSFKVVSLLR